MSVMAGSDIASVMLGPSYVDAVQGCKFQDICVSAKGGGATLALRNGFRPAAGVQRSRKARRAGENAHRAGGAAQTPLFGVFSMRPIGIAGPQLCHRSDLAAPVGARLCFCQPHEAGFFAACANRGSSAGTGLGWTCENNRRDDQEEKQ